MQLVNGNLIMDLSSRDGNAFCVMGAVKSIMKQCMFSEDIEKYLNEAQSGDYLNLLRVSRDVLNDLGIKFVDSSNSYPEVLAMCVVTTKVEVV